MLLETDLTKGVITGAMDKRAIFAFALENRPKPPRFFTMFVITVSRFGVGQNLVILNTGRC